jgi:predicted nucleotidyltransferase
VDDMNLKEAMQLMTDEIIHILAENEPSVYCFGSVVHGDFKLGWSDIDIIVLTKNEITQPQADMLVGLRQKLLEHHPGNPYFRLFEGGMLSEDAFLHNKNERTVYWGTSGQRITNRHSLDSFAMAELLDGGILLHGKDIRSKMVYPHYSQMRDDVANHIKTARIYGTSVGWLLDITRGIYTLRTGKMISKTAAGEWALENNLCPDTNAMSKAVEIRKNPQNYSKDEYRVDNAVIQRFADIADAELKKNNLAFIEKGGNNSHNTYYPTLPASQTSTSFSNATNSALSPSSACIPSSFICSHTRCTSLRASESGV